jgi:hypothetical protein
MNETKEKKNKAKQKRDSERENIQYHFVHLLHFSTCVLEHIDECSISAGRNKRRTNRTNTINQSPHNLKRKSKERNYYDEMEKMKREKQFCSKSLTSIISPIPLLANECQLSDEQLTTIRNSGFVTPRNVWSPFVVV